MHVLIIGGNRFVGRLLAWRLLAGGHRVTLLNRGNLPDPFGDRVERVRCDRTLPAFEQALADRSFDAAVDLAAFTADDGRRAAALFRGRVGHTVMISSGQVYLVREGCPTPSREEDYDGPVMARPEDPEDLRQWEYGVGKRDCEDALAAGGRDGLAATRVRIPMVSGPLDYRRRLEAYLWRLADGGPVLVPDGGAHRVRLADGSEVARFVSGILGRPEAVGRAFNVAQEEVPTLAELLAALRERLGSRSELVPIASAALCAARLDPAAVSPLSTRWMSLLDPSRARGELGFVHAPLSEGLSAAVAAFLSHPPADRPAALTHRQAEVALAARAR